ncbi:choline transport system permease protein OpuBB [Tissierella creatinophila DSM 6911]|uniref:Choline transport system permease protein OpuBB n=1 Tax=Tissierella creatinophila DSM 6911 TaxID=1123403 RepID=A0A1U7M7I5_TISCR|nr:choline transport system permease protein OpuBB [Tissierella creatinophila DSM 6911]
MDMIRVARALTELVPINFAIHISLVLISLTIAILIGIPLGILLSRNKVRVTSNIALQLLNTLQTIPAFAFIAISIPLLGFGYLPTIVVLVIQAVLPIVKGTMVGMLEVDNKAREAAKGLGMTDMEVLRELEIPLSTPYILNGIKTSSTYVVSISTLAGFIGAGGLGVLISSGIAMLYPEYLFIGASLCAVIALTMNFFIEKIETKLMIKVFGSDD